MKIRTKMIIAFVAVILTPILLIFSSLMLMGQFQMRSFRNSYGITNMEDLMSSNVLSIFTKMTESVKDEICRTIEMDPEQMENVEQWEAWNDQLELRKSFLVVNREEEVVYCGEKKLSDSFYDQLFDENSVAVNLGNNSYCYYIGEENQCLVTQVNFLYSDGESGQAFLVTKINSLFPEFRSILVDIAVMVVLVLIVTAVILTTWLYSSIIRPLSTLQKATQEIKNGNLDFSLQVEGKDEISELCRGFEDMRVRLKETAEEKIQYDRENKILISNISHDLKTPMTAVKGYCEGILDGVASSPEKLEKYIRTIYNKANDMEKLIDELTLYSKIDTNRIPYNFTKISVKDYFSDCAEELRMDLEARNVELTFANYLKDDVVVIGDGEQLKRVINNIVSNSVKYMDKKKGFISLRLRDEGDFIQVEIEDNGKGIAAKDIPYIFDRFYRTDSSRNSSTGGSGIGLSIVRKIIEDHGGRIWATSKEGTGTIMHFVLRKYQEVPYE
ncbi:MAG: HAMP domain-containing sensor histidine kinase [Clostridiales bacterium]|nr:HAMP domain-containing sensor histidine kinase [Clostridiales bacterium]